jgi:hypothetical protein
MAPSPQKIREVLQARRPPPRRPSRAFGDLAPLDAGCTELGQYELAMIDMLDDP